MSNIDTKILIQALSKLSKSDDTETSTIAHNALVESNAIGMELVNVLIGIDVSGSSHVHAILQKLKEINTLFNTPPILAVKYAVVYFNHQLVSVHDYDDISIISGDDIVVDGGNDFNVFYDYLECNPDVYDKWFIITDGFFPRQRIHAKHTWNWLETRMLVY